jgi:hypothetical protein
MKITSQGRSGAQRMKEPGAYARAWHLLRAIRSFKSEAAVQCVCIYGTENLVEALPVGKSRYDT